MKLLVVDDSALMRRSLRECFDCETDVEVATARDGEDALARVRSFDPDVVTLDINMPVMDGLTCLSRIMTEMPRPVVMVSSLTAKGAMATFEALELGAVDYVAKPGGTVSLNLREAFPEIVAKVRAAARARPARARRERLAADRPARTTKMLSINASIEAARAADGAGFAVVAREVGDLSMHTDRTTQEMARLIDAALAGLDRFLAGSRRLEGELQTVVAMAERMIAHLRSVATVYAAMQGYIADLTSRVDGHGRTIEQLLIEAFAKVQFQDIVRQHLEGVVGGLDDLRRLADAEAAPGVAGNDDAGCLAALGRLVDRLRETYVMQQQREAHARATGGAALAGSGGPAIELF